jgi:hypothetical protein
MTEYVNERENEKGLILSGFMRNQSDETLKDLINSNSIYSKEAFDELEMRAKQNKNTSHFRV